MKNTLQILLSLFLVACGSSSAVNTDSNEIIVDPAPIPVPTPEPTPAPSPNDPPVTAVPNAATEKLISEGFNQPKTNPEQWAIFSTDIEEYYVAREEVIQNALNNSFGGYMNYNWSH